MYDNELLNLGFLFCFVIFSFLWKCCLKQDFCIKCIGPIALFVLLKIKWYTVWNVIYRIESISNFKLGPQVICRKLMSWKSLNSAGTCCDLDFIIEYIGKGGFIWRIRGLA